MFHKVVEADIKDDPEVVKEYVTDRMYKVLENLAEKNRADNIDLVRKDIDLETAQIVEVADYKDDSKDQVWIYLSGKWVEYYTNKESGVDIVGEKEKKTFFNEIWKLKRKEDTWVLDQIDERVTPADFREKSSFSENLTEIKD